MDSTKPVRILVVDDEGINQLYLKKFFSKKGWQIDAAYNGIEALEKYEKNEYDIILMDAHMPEMDGFEATRIIRQKEKEKNTHTPIIAITAYALCIVEEKFIKAGVDDFMLKPFDEEKMLLLIQKFLDHRKS